MKEGRGGVALPVLGAGQVHVSCWCHCRGEGYLKGSSGRTLSFSCWYLFPLCWRREKLAVTLVKGVVLDVRLPILARLLSCWWASLAQSPAAVAGIVRSGKLLLAAHLTKHVVILVLLVSILLVVVLILVLRIAFGWRCGKVNQIREHVGRLQARGCGNCKTKRAKFLSHLILTHKMSRLRVFLPGQDRLASVGEL